MKNKVKVNFDGFTILLLNIALFLLLSLTTDTFFSYNNIYAVFFGMSIQSIALIGFTFLVILGEIDLSVGAVYGFSGIATSLLNMYFRVPFSLSVLIVLVLCTAYGYMIGAVTVKLELNSMMVTLGSMTLVKGVSAILFSKAGPGIYPEEFRNFAKFKVLGVHWTIYLFVVIVIITEFAQRKTSLFKKLFFTGSNLESARIYGIKSEKIKTNTFALSSFCAAFAGIIAASRITHSDLVTGEGLEIIFITAAVIGGVKLTGGSGSYLSASLGLMFLTFLTNGMYIYKINPLMQQIAVGAILVLSVYADIALGKERIKFTSITRKGATKCG